MWWPETQGSPSFGGRRRVGVLLVVFGLLVLLGGCGFQSLYGEKGGGQASADLAQVKVRTIPDRTGQIMHNELRDLLNPNGPPARPRHELDVKTTEDRELVAVQKTAFATRVNLKIVADFKLYPARGQEPVFTGKETVISSYDISESDYATLVARDDARERGARELAERIRTKLAVYFHGLRGGS